VYIVFNFYAFARSVDGHTGIVRQKLFLPGQWKKTVKTVAKASKNRQNQRHHKLITDFITHILQAAFEPYYNSGTDSEHK